MNAYGWILLVWAVLLVAWCLIGRATDAWVRRREDSARDLDNETQGVVVVSCDEVDAWLQGRYLR